MVEMGESFPSVFCLPWEILDLSWTLDDSLKHHMLLEVCYSYAIQYGQFQKKVNIFHKSNEEPALKE